MSNNKRTLLQIESCLVKLVDVYLARNSLVSADCARESLRLIDNIRDQYRSLIDFKPYSTSTELEKVLGIFYSKDGEPMSLDELYTKLDTEGTIGG